MSASRVNPDGKLTQLDAKAGADEVVTEQDVQQPSKLARVLCAALKSLAELNRRFNPHTMDFEDLVSTGVADSPQSITLQHNFGQQVRWWLTDVHSTGTVTLPLVAKDTSATDDNTLVLNVHFQATISIRVQGAG